MLQAAGLADRLHALDPAAAALGLGAALDLAHQDGVADGPLGGVVGGIDLGLGDVGERSQRLVFVEQSGGEVRGAGVPAGGALLKQGADLRAQRRQLGGEPVGVTTLGEVDTMSGDHLAGERDELCSAAAGDAGALGDPISSSAPGPLTFAATRPIA